MGVFARFLARMWLSGLSLLILALATWGFAQLPELQRPPEPTPTAALPLPPAAPPRAPAVLPSIPVVAVVPAATPVPPAALSPPVATGGLGAASGLGATSELGTTDWLGAARGLAPAAFAPPTGGPGQPLAPPAPGGVTAEQRLQALEQQNLKLAAELAELRRQIPPRPVGREAPLGDLQKQLGRQRDPSRDVIETGDEPLPRARVDLTQGVRLLSPDGKYRIELHDLTQFDARFFSVTSPSGTNASQGALHDSFVIPRQRLYFTGQVDDYFDFYSVINRGYGIIDILDSFANFKFDKTFNIRVGRTKTPYGYEYYKIAEGDLIAPERSVFVGNLSPNRQLMAMAFGRLLEERVEYAVGVESGPRRSFQDFNNFKNPVFYLNTKPFLYGGSDLLRNLNLGGSVNFGREDDPLEPNALRTANDETTTPNATNVSPTFLRFNTGVVQRGGTAFWSGDVAWYYRSLTALAMYNGGYITYATNTRSNVRVPYEGGSVALTFFVTGEEIVRRHEVEPLRDFSWRSPLNNPGAIELYTRTSYLNAGQDIFTGGLADPALWSRNALVLDHGVNWYLNRFVQVRFDWQFSAFGSPVQIGPGRFTRSENMFWLRTQIYY